MGAPDAIMDDTEARVDRTCSNCGTPSEGEYCPSCGQSTGTIDMPVSEFARDLASEVLGLDSRVRRTLWPLIRYPGRVPRAYVEGHRARFVPPVRLYLLASFLMFVTLSSGQLDVETVDVGGRTVTADSVAAAGQPEREGGGPRTSLQVDLGGDELNERLSRGFQRLLEDQSEFNRVFVDRLATGMFVLLPVFAGLLKLMWWRRWYVHHLVFAVYYHAFVFLLVAVANLPDVLGLHGIGAVLDLGLLFVPVYLLFGLRTFYQDGWVKTTLKTVLVTAIYGLLSAAAIMALLLTSVLSL